MKLFKIKTLIFVISFASGLIGLIVDSTDLFPKIQKVMNELWIKLPEFWRLILTWSIVSIIIYFLLLESSRYWLKFKRKIRRTVIESTVKYNATEIEIIKNVVLPKLFQNENDLMEFLVNVDTEKKDVTFKISDESIIKLIGNENFNDFKDMKITVSTIAKILSELFPKTNKNESNSNNNPVSR